MPYIYSKNPMRGDFGDFTETVGLIRVDETKHERFWDDIMKEHHYLGYVSVIGGRVKYLIALGERLVGGISFCSAAFQLGLRDKYVGWNDSERKEMLPHLVCNNRFLIFPWIEIKNLASHVLALSLKRMATDWRAQYQVEPYMVETFVDKSRFGGTCYIADNWVDLGETKGYGRVGKEFVYHGNVKELFVKIINPELTRKFQPDLGRLEVEAIVMELVKNLELGLAHDSLEDSGLDRLTPEVMRRLLARHLKPYIRYLNRVELHQYFANSVIGKLSDLAHKCVESICKAYATGSDYRNMCNFFTRAAWDNEGMLREHQREVSRFLHDPDGMLTADGCDFPKYGNMSPGVARQYCGRLGKTDSCMASVMIGLAGAKGHGLLDCELHLPEKWLGDDYADKRAKCHIPDELTFKTKNEQLSELINKACDSGCFKGRYVGVDAGFGRDTAFLDSLPGNLIFFVDIPCNTHVFREMPEMAIPAYSGRGRRPKLAAPSFPSETVKEIIADERIGWNDVVMGMGAHGPIISRDKYLPVVEIRNGKPGKRVWLYARRLDDGKIKYSLCNESMDATPDQLRKPAMMRWSIEQCFKECKEYLGMDHFQGRSYIGWRRHILLTFIAHLFLVKLQKTYGVKPGPEREPVPVVDIPASAG